MSAKQKKQPRIPSPTAPKAEASSAESKKNLKPTEKRKLTDFVPLLPLHWLERFGWQAGLFVVLAFVLYGNTLTHEFAIDDRIVYTENTFVKEGFAGIPKILKYDTFLGYFGEKQENLLQGGRYRPLSLVTFAIEYDLFKDAKGNANPFTGHFINVLIYALSLVLLLALLRRFMLSPAWAFLAVLIFAVHPIHTEVVANIKSRDELMGFFFCMATLFGALYALEDAKKRWWSLGLATISFALALLSKENALSYLVILPLTFYYFGKKANLRTQLAFAIPFVAIIGLYGLYRVNMPGGIVTTTSNANVMNDPFLLIPNNADSAAKEQKAAWEQYKGKYTDEKGAIHDFSSFTNYKYGTIFYVLGRYVGLLIFPHPLSWDYGFPQMLHVSNDLEKSPHLYRKMGEPASLLSFLLYVGIFVFALLGLKNRTGVSWALWFYLFTVFIVSNIAVNIGGFLGERFVYQSSLAFAILLSAALLKLNEWETITDPAVRRQVVLALGVVLVLAGSAKTIARNSDWKNDSTIFLADVEHCPNSAHTHKTAGGVFFRMATDSTDKTMTPQKKEMLLDTAMVHYQQSLKLYPQFPDAINDVVVVWRYVNPIRDAKNQRWIELLNYNFDYPWPHTDATKAGKLFEEARINRNDLDYAVQKLQEAIYYQPTNPDYWYILAAKVYFAQCNYDQAARCLVKCTQLKPDNASYWHDLGVAYHNNHSFVEAKNAFLRCAQVAPNFGPLAASLAKTEDQYKKEGKTYPPVPFPIIQRTPIAPMPANN